MAFLPPGVTSVTLAAMPQIAYYNTAIREWIPNTPFLEKCCDFKPMARRAGRTLQFYGQKPYGPATSTASEGLPPNSLSLSQVVSDVFADQFVDWIGISDVAEKFFVSDVKIDATRNLSLRGALTANLVAVTAFDVAATADSTTRIDLGDNEFMLSSTVRKAEAQLVGNSVPGRDGGTYALPMSAFMSYDLISDNTAGGVTDVAKRNDPTILTDGQVRNYQEFLWSGCRIIRTPTISTFSNFPSTGKTGYGAYAVGNEAMLASNLVGVDVPKSPESFNVMVTPLTTPDLSNPALQTNCLVSYNWFLGVAPRPNTNGTGGFRRIRGEVSAV